MLSSVKRKAIEKEIDASIEELHKTKASIIRKDQRLLRRRSRRRGRRRRKKGSYKVSYGKEA